MPDGFIHVSMETSPVMSNPARRASDGGEVTWAGVPTVLVKTGLAPWSASAPDSMYR